MAKLKSFKASRGVTIERNGVYHKFNTEVEIELSDGDNTSEVKNKAWSTVENELKRKIDELLNDEDNEVKKGGHY